MVMGLKYKKINDVEDLSQFLQSDLVWTHKWPFQGLSELHFGNQKVTLKKLDDRSFRKPQFH